MMFAKTKTTQKFNKVESGEPMAVANKAEQNVDKIEQELSGDYERRKINCLGETATYLSDAFGRWYQSQCYEEKIDENIVTHALGISTRRWREILHGAEPTPHLQFAEQVRKELQTWIDDLKPRKTEEITISIRLHLPKENLKIDTVYESRGSGCKEITAKLDAEKRAALLDALQSLVETQISEVHIEEVKRPLGGY
jgi:hypothetical protein